MTYLRRAPHKQRGDQAENLALEFLLARGLTLIKRNHLCRMGEVDLIMQDSAVTVFVEVRLRSNGNTVGALTSSNNWASAAESIDARKQLRIMTAARHYLIGRPGAPCRFDCVLLSRLDAAAIEWMRDAFSA